ncbi:MAG: hypothetical protein KAT38_15070 [Bacteroidales bacterium]|nr:hypothetical protein [Bacteroidales bacterium]
MDYSILIGSVGVLLLLLAFIMNLFNILKTSSFLYSFLNFLGAGIACYASVLIDFIPFVILEIFWALVGLWGMIKTFSKKPEQSSHPVF